MGRVLQKFRDGLWLSIIDEDCRIDVKRPVERWPDCAQASFVRDGERFVMDWADSDGDRSRRRKFAGWERDTSLVANGSPLIVQVEMAKDRAPLPSGTAAYVGPDEPSWRYIYYAVNPTQFDHQSRVLAVETWPIQCGPISEPVPANKASGQRSTDEESAEIAPNVTDRPFRGLTVIANNCTAENVDALQRAAALSKSLEGHGSMRWIRDGWR